MRAQTIKKPRLTADTTTLFNLYYNDMTVDSQKLQDTFGVCPATSRKVINFCLDYAIEQGGKPCIFTKNKYITTKLLFDVYGWDIKDIAERQKIKSKYGGKQRNASETA